MNEVTKPKTDIVLSKTYQGQVQLANEVEEAAYQAGAHLTEYGKKCAINAIASFFTYCKVNGISAQDVDGTLLRLAIQNIAYTELNVAATPSEVYFDLRKTNTDDGKTIYLPSFKPQGAGNEKLMRKYGVGLAKENGLSSPWLVREGDDFELPYFDGPQQTPPKWRPKSLDAKIVMVVYIVKKTDGSYEYLMATREGVKPNIVAQVRQNTLYAFKKKETIEGKVKTVVDTETRDKFYAEIDELAEELTVDEFIKHPKIVKYINPTYTSGGSREQMILRKMKNNALKNYPKEFDNTYSKEALDSMREEFDESLNEKPQVKHDVIDAVETEINEKPVSENAPKDFVVDDDGVVENPTEKEESNPTEEKPTTKEEPKQDNYEDLL